MGAGGAVDPRVCSASARRRDRAVGATAGVHGDRVHADQRVRVAGSAALVRSAVPDRASSRHPVDRAGSTASCTMSCLTNSGAEVCPTGVARSWTVRVFARKRGSLTGPSPVDRGKPGSKIHVLSDRGGLPLAVTISAVVTRWKKLRKLTTWDELLGPSSRTSEAALATARYRLIATYRAGQSPTARRGSRSRLRNVPVPLVRKVRR